MTVTTEARRSRRSSTGRRHLLLTVAIYPEGNQWVSEVMDFELASCGDSAEHAYAMIREAVELLLDTTADEVREILADRRVAVWKGIPNEYPLAPLRHGLAEEPGLIVRPLIHELPADRVT